METRKVSIIRPDNTVVIDGKAHSVDLASMHPYIHAVQWDGKAGAGHIEFVRVAGAPFALNIPIPDPSGWAAAIEAWDAAEADEQRRAEELREATRKKIEAPGRPEPV